MVIYTIKDLEKLCGIKAHTIRMWEQRYGIVVPNRSKNNVRHYCDADLKYLLSIALLNKNGFKISKIAKMSKEEVAQKIASISKIIIDVSSQLEVLTLSMIEMDELKFDKIISTNIKQIGFERTMLHIIYPFMNKLGVLWLTGSIQPVQENFMKHLIRQKIIAAINAIPFSSKTKDTFLLYLPEEETQELDLLFIHYLLKLRSFKVIYLGQNVPMSDLLEACKLKKPNYIFTILSEKFSKKSVCKYIEKVSGDCCTSKILISGYQITAQKVESKNNVTVFQNLNNLISFLKVLNSK